MKKTEKEKTSLRFVLYLLSGLALSIGLLTLLVLLGASTGISSYELYFQLMGLENFAPMILNPLRAGLINLGIILFILLLGVSALLFAGGRLIAHQVGLAERIRRLEEQVRENRGNETGSTNS